MTTDDRTEARHRTQRQDGAPTTTSTLSARQRAASSARATAKPNATRTVAILATLLALASHGIANNPYGWEATAPQGAAGSARPVEVRVVVYPFGALQDGSAERHGTAQVDPSTRTLLESAGVARVEDLPYPMAALVSRSREDATVQLNPYAAPGSGPARAPRVEVVVYPFAALQGAPASNATAQVDRSTRALLESADVARVGGLPYPIAY